MSLLTDVSTRLGYMDSCQDSAQPVHVHSREWPRVWLLRLAWCVYLASFVMPVNVIFPTRGFGAAVYVLAFGLGAIPILLPNGFVIASLSLFMTKNKKRTALVLLPLALIGVVISGALGDMFQVGAGSGYYFWLLSQFLFVVAYCDVLFFNRATRLFKGASSAAPQVTLAAIGLLSLVLFIPWCQRRAGNAMVDAARTDSSLVARIGLLIGGHANSTKKKVLWDNTDGPEAIEIAAERGSDRVLRLLLKSVGDVNRVKEYHQPLLFHAVRSRKLSTVDLLLEHEANAQQTEKNGLTPLHIAATQGDVAIMESLVTAGAPVDAQAKIGVTPLHYAASTGRADAVRFLLDHGADPRKKDHESRTPLDHARRQIESQEATAKSAEKAYDQAQVKRSLDHANRCREVLPLLEGLTRE